MELPAESAVSDPRNRLERNVLKDKGKSSLYGNPHGIIRTDRGEDQGNAEPGCLLVIGEEVEGSPKKPYQRDGNQQQSGIGHIDREVDCVKAVFPNEQMASRKDN